MTTVNATSSFSKKEYKILTSQGNEILAAQYCMDFFSKAKTLSNFNLVLSSPKVIM